MSKHPTLFRWDATAAVMVAMTPGLARSRYVGEQEYLLLDVEARSAKSHDHEFAWLGEAWKSLPENLADIYPTAEHLRKRALIIAGYFRETITDAGSNAAALRIASFVRSREEFAMVFVRGPYVVVRDPESQARGAMDKERFQASKTAIMGVVADLLGVTVETLAKAREAA